MPLSYYGDNHHCKEFGQELRTFATQGLVFSSQPARRNEEISGFCCCVVQIFILLGCHTAPVDLLPTFQDGILVLSLGVTMEPIYCPRMSVANRLKITII